MSHPSPHSHLVARRSKNGSLAIIEKIHKPPARLNASDARAQATLMMVKRLFGDTTLADLGAEFHMSPRNAQRRLEQARTDGVPDAARRVVIEHMLPQSLAVMQEALEGEDLDLAVKVAIKVVEGLKAMDAPGPESSTIMEESFEIYRARITRTTPSGDPDPLYTGAERRDDPAEGSYIDASLAASASEPSAAPARIEAGSGDAPETLPLQADGRIDPSHSAASDSTDPRGDRSKGSL